MSKPMRDNCDAVLPAVTLIRECDLNIEVVGLDGTNLEGVEVTVSIIDATPKVMNSGSNGQAAFEKLPETATAALVLSKLKYTSVEMSISMRDNCDAVLPMATLVRKCDLTIAVTDSVSGSSLDNVKVTMTIGGVDTEVTTGSDGQARFTGLSESATASIKLKKAGYDDGSMTKVIKDNCDAVETVNLVAGPTCSFSFKTTDAISGSSISGATVTLTSTATGERTYQSSSSGYANVPDIPYNVDLMITVTKSSYDPEVFNFNSKDNCGGPTFPAAMNPTNPDGRLILTWRSNSPRDIDIYMQDSTDCKLYYRRKSCRGGASTLDKDNMVRIFYSFTSRNGKTHIIEQLFCKYLFNVAVL